MFPLLLRCVAHVLLLHRYLVFVDKRLEKCKHFTVGQALKEDNDTRSAWSEFVNTGKGNLTQAIRDPDVRLLALEAWNAVSTDVLRRFALVRPPTKTLTATRASSTTMAPPACSLHSSVSPSPPSPSPCPRRSRRTSGIRSGTTRGSAVGSKSKRAPAGTSASFCTSAQCRRALDSDIQQCRAASD